MRTRYQYRLLLCDQRDQVYEYIRARLPSQEEVTYEVQRAASQEEALKLLESPQWDLVFCGQPEGSASNLAFVGLCHQRAPELPLIFLLDHDDPAIKTQAEQAGAHDCLALPDINSALLTRVVRYTVDQRNGQRSANEPPLEHKRADFELLSQIKEALIALDENFVLTAWNRAAEELYGWSAEEVIGHPLFDVIRFEAPHTEIAKALNSFVRNGAYQVEATQYRRDGSKITVVSNVVAVFGPNGKIEGFILQNRDVSEQKRAEEERKQIFSDLHNARLRAEHMAVEARQRANELEVTFESMVDAVLIFGLGDQPVRANRAAVQIFGFDPTGPDWEDLSHRIRLHDRQGNLINRAAQPFYRALQGESIQSANFRLTNPAGDVFSLLVSSSPLYNNGHISGAVAVLKDNTEQEQLISSLEAERSRLSTIFANMHEAIVLTDPGGNILISNPPANLEYFHALFYAQQKEFNVLHPDGTPYQRDDFPLKRSIHLGESHVNLEMVVQNGEQERHFLASTAPIVDRKGQITGALGVFQDITERKKTEEEIRRRLSTTEIQHYLTQYRDQEHLNIAYDLHDGPLQEMIGLSFKLNALIYQVEDEAVRSELSESYDLAQKVIKEVRAFCNDLRPPTLGEFGLDKTIRSYTEKLRLQYPEVLFHLNMELQHNLGHEVRIALFRIYKELMQNVLRHSLANQVYVRLVSLDQSIVMEVQDDGRGFDMPEDWVDLARNGHLGLVGVRERAESVGGQAEITSIPGKGTSALIMVPLSERQIIA